MGFFEDVGRGVSGTLNSVNRDLSNLGNNINREIDNPIARAVITGGMSIPFELAGVFGKKAGSSGGGGSSPSAQNPAYMGLDQSEAYKKLRQQASTKGMSPWAGLALSKQNLLASEGMDEAAKRANAQLGQQMGNLAAAGGMTSGARERAIAQAPQNYMNMAAEIGKQKAISGLDIAMEDAKRKQGLLDKVGALEMRDIEGRNAYNQNLYNQQMAQWAAREQAQATRDSGSKGLFGRGGFLGLGI